MHVIPCQEICNAVTWPDIWPDEVLAVQWPEIRQLIQIRLLQNEANKEEKTGFIISCIIVVEANDPPDLVEKEIISSLRKIEVDQPIDEVFTLSNSVQYFPLISVQFFPLFRFSEPGFCDA